MGPCPRGQHRWRRRPRVLGWEAAAGPGWLWKALRGPGRSGGGPAGVSLTVLKPAETSGCVLCDTAAGKAEGPRGARAARILPTAPTPPGCCSPVLAAGPAGRDGTWGGEAALSAPHPARPPLALLLEQIPQGGARALFGRGCGRPSARGVWGGGGWMGTLGPSGKAAGCWGGAALLPSRGFCPTGQGP